MQILIASNSYPTAKNPTRQVFIKNIERGLNDKGHQSKLIYNRYFDYFNSPQETGSIFTRITKLFFLLSSYLPVFFTGKRKFDIVYSHAPLLPGLLMTIFSKIYKVKHVTYAHGAVIQFSNKRGLSYRLAKYTMQQCDMVFTNSEYMREQLLADYGIKSLVVTPGYNSKVFYNKHRERNMDLLFAGNCIKRKGAQVFLKAINYHRRFYESNSISVHLHCSGKEKTGIIEYCREKQLYDIVTIGSKLEENQLSEAYNSAKIFVFPSLNEPLGLVGIEAIACGTFLIASDVGGIPEYVVNGKNGLLFEPGDSNSLHNAIKKTLGDSLWQQNMSRVEENRNGLQLYTIEYGTNQAVKHFKSLVE